MDDAMLREIDKDGIVIDEVYHDKIGGIFSRFAGSWVLRLNGLLSKATARVIAAQSICVARDPSGRRYLVFDMDGYVTDISERETLALRELGERWLADLREE